MTRTRRSLLGLFFLLAASCGGGGGDGPGGQPGNLTVQFSETGPTPGAIYFTVSGGVIDGVTAVNPSSVQVTWFAPAPGTTRIVVTGALAVGDLLTLHVPDIAAAASYLPLMNQVADNATFALLGNGPYSLSIHK